MKKNNELEFESDKVKSYVQQLQAENGLLSQANEQLKSQIELIKISNQTTIDNLKRELIDQEAETLKAGGIINYLEKTLSDIEKLAIQGNVYCIDYNVNDCEKCIKQYDCKTTLFKQILNKINECEINNEK